VHRLFTEIAPDMAARPGGYTRITKIGSRKGDNAPMAVIELVREPLSAKKATVAEAEAATKRSAKDKKATKSPAAQEAEATGATSTAATDGGYGAESAVPLEDGTAPQGFTVKGNKDSMKYHTTESQWYDQTVAEVWFTTAEAAEAAGFVAPGGDKADDDAEA